MITPSTSVPALDVMCAALLRRLGDEVDLIFRYGSALKGTAHHYSDLDISYVPAHEATWASITILLDDTLIDLYPIHWSRLEQMANFENVSSTVLLEGQIVYQRTAAAAERFRQLAAQLRELQEPAAYPRALEQAQRQFEQLGYAYYLLRQAAQSNHLPAAMQQAHHILSGIAHCLAVCNQAVIDTRRLAQVLALPKLPADFAATVAQITSSTDPAELFAAGETLMDNTRALLLTEQQRVKTTSGFPEVFAAAYPELKGDLQHVMLACERGDRYDFRLISLYHELMIHAAQAQTGIPYSGFNLLAEYEQDLTALGFPDLLAFVQAGDWDGLHQQCAAFDQRLRAYLTEHGVPLYSFATLDELREHLK